MWCFYVVVVEMRGQYGYLSAIEWPLLPVSGRIVHLISYLFEYFDLCLLWHGQLCASLCCSHF